VNGGQDLGGTHGFGPVVAEPNEPVFHAEWERRAFAITVATGFPGRWNIDMSRWYRENRDPRDYLSSSYYELWLKGLERLIEDTRLLEQKVEAPDAAKMRTLVASSRGAKVEADVPARFRVGNRVRVRNAHPRTHTRMPRYCRGKSGVIAADHGVYIFPDTHALGLGPKPQHCYSVRFSAEELWGEKRNDSVHIDLWDDYLEPA
jgi:nitrile hydratase